MREAAVDASFGVLWFLDQVGSEEARAVLQRHSEAEISLVMDRHCYVELLSVMVSRRGVQRARDAKRAMELERIRVVEVDDDLLDDALLDCMTLGCGLYDAIPVALARRLSGTLFSADVRAHAAFEGVVLLG
jgi:predicted nucleic acid-binding protein